MVCRRTIDATAANVPTPKIKKRAYFSRVGRLIERRVLMGRTRIQMSVRMLNAEVALVVKQRPLVLFTYR